MARIVDTISDKIDLWLITRDRDLGSSNPYPKLSGQWIRRGRSRVFYLDTGRLGQWLRLRRELSAIRFDLLYVNSLWNPVFTAIPIVALSLGLLHARKVLIAPRGELSLGALSIKTKKKRVFLNGWGPFLRSMDVTWHASSENEASEIQAVLPWARVGVNRDQTSLPYEPLPVTVANDGCARLVFISRISPMKNLDLILRALPALSEPIELDIYGPLEDRGYWSKCQSLIRQAPSTAHVKYQGELAPSDVRRTFSGYDAFIFPTRGENFGHVIAESLSASCPVVCSNRTPWTSVLETGGGAIVPDLTPVGLVKELKRIAAMTTTDRLRAREAAGIAYRSWRSGVGAPNILEQVRISESSSRV